MHLSHHNCYDVILRHYDVSMHHKFKELFLRHYGNASHVRSRGLKLRSISMFNSDPSHQNHYLFRTYISA